MVPRNDNKNEVNKAGIQLFQLDSKSFEKYPQKT